MQMGVDDRKGTITQRYRMRNKIPELLSARLFALILFLAAISSPAQTSLASNVLVVYASNDPDSTAVGAYYADRRGIPNANLCPVTLPNPAATALNGPNYESFLRIPVQACLNNLGAGNILYIVLAYLRPYAVSPGTGLNYYALDSYLADIWDQYTTQIFDPYPTETQPYYADNQSQGNVFIPFQSLATYRALGSLPLIYSVWRLDGPTPASAMALVDNALAAEWAGGPISQVSGSPTNACIDMAADPTGNPDDGYRAADWDLFRAAQFLSATYSFQVVTDMSNEVFGTAPAPDCRNTALYTGWYNYGRYNDAFSWNPGSIGWDLDSGALIDPRSGVWWGSNALARGLTVTSGPVAEPYLEGLARPDGTMLNLLQGANVGDAFLRNTRWLKWMILNVGDPLYKPFPGALPPFDRPLAVNSLALNPREVVGGYSNFSATLTLAEPAPPEGLVVNLWTDNAAVSVPSSITVEGGEASVTFLAMTAALTETTDIRITAQTPSMSVSNTEILDPLLSDLRLSQNRVKGGNEVAAAVFLNAGAPEGGVTVQLSSDMPEVAAVPATVFIPAGSSQANFVITTSPVASSTNVSINAYLAGAQATTVLTVIP
jgi:uncharacterized protein (TIGR03790 family)